MLAVFDRSGDPLPRRGRRIAVRLAISLASLALALGLAEVALRTLGLAGPRAQTWGQARQDDPLKKFAQDRIMGWRMPPSTSFAFVTDGVLHQYESDELGRRVDRSAPAAPRRELLSIAGDSFAWGYGVDYCDSFAARIAAGLGGWRVANWSMPAFGVDQIALAFEHYLLPEKPDFAIVAIFPGDFERSLHLFRWKDGLTKPTFRLEDGVLVPRTQPNRPDRVTAWLNAHSRVWATLRLANWRSAYVIPHGEWWELNRTLLERILSQARTAGVDVLFVHVPNREWRGFPALGRFLRGEGASFLDPVELADEPPPGSYFETDNHLSAAGHRWLSERILDWLHVNRPQLFR